MTGINDMEPPEPENVTLDQKAVTVSKKNGSHVFHAYSDCEKLGNAKRTRTVDRAIFPHREMCGRCVDRFETMNPLIGPEEPTDSDYNFWTVDNSTNHLSVYHTKRHCHNLDQARDEDVTGHVERPRERAVCGSCEGTEAKEAISL